VACRENCGQVEMKMELNTNSYSIMSEILLISIILKSVMCSVHLSKFTVSSSIKGPRFCFIFESSRVQILVWRLNSLTKVICGFPSVLPDILG
jgi:hypothetical protein